MPAIALATVGVIGLLLIPSAPVHASTTLYFGSIEKTYDDSGVVVEEKVYYPAGNAVAVKQSTTNDQQSTISFLHSDHLGSTVLVTKDDGTIESSLTYYPYGDIPVGTSLPENTLDKLYTGQRKDNSTNLYYYNARYYNPAIGHFISADKAEGPNRYAYVGNNPMMRNDPSGMMDSADDGVGGAEEEPYVTPGAQQIMGNTADINHVSNITLKRTGTEYNRRANSDVISKFIFLFTPPQKVIISESDLNSPEWLTMKNYLDEYVKSRLCESDNCGYSEIDRATAAAFGLRNYQTDQNMILYPLSLYPLIIENILGQKPYNLPQTIRRDRLLCFERAVILSLYLGQYNIKTNIVGSDKLRHVWLEIPFRDKPWVLDPGTDTVAWEKSVHMLKRGYSTNDTEKIADIFSLFTYFPMILR